MAAAEADNWNELVLAAVSQWGTPCYVFCWDAVAAALAELKALEQNVPIRHWFSFKTQPIRSLIREWKVNGGGVEVVSEFELRAALHEGFRPEDILVNGVAKDRWLKDCQVSGLRIHLDSLREARVLGICAANRGWHLGVRCCVQGQLDPDEPSFSGQFGLSQAEVPDALSQLSDSGVFVESVHFHLRSNIESPEVYGVALSDLAGICRRAHFAPRYVDCGGGLPIPEDRTVTPAGPFDLARFRDVLTAGALDFPGLREFWLENGRFVTARSGVLVVGVRDIKDRPESRYLICDGGRTNHALVSDREAHEVRVIPERTGPAKLTTVCGPTCMKYDRLCRCPLPEDVQVGDLIIWMNAGAYHIPWETRFSHGLAPVVWIDGTGAMALARSRETFEAWWGTWR